MKKKYLVVGMGRSGIDACKFLIKHNNDVYAYDGNASFPNDIANKLRAAGCSFSCGEFDISTLDNIDEIVLSPGVPPHLPFIDAARKIGIHITGEIELAYKNCPANIIAITGTNGKTTTTALTGEIMKTAGYNTHVVGNIGTPFISVVDEISSNDVAVAEISSYQLETAETFKPYICAILNVTPDHLSRHGTFENYVNAKKKIYENMHGGYVILNADNAITASIDCGDNTPVYFSTSTPTSRGAWFQDGDMMMKIDENEPIKICSADDMYIKGMHNIQNALAACLLAYIYGADLDSIRCVLQEFKGVEHRIEYCGTAANGVCFYNDSKGTNCDSTIIALAAMTTPCSLILGGFDKGGGFEELFDAIVKNGRVTKIVVIGQTADKIMATANNYKYTSIEKCTTFDEACEKAFFSCKENESVLLSPACASWDMFKNFEQRGEVFKKKVAELILGNN